MRAKNDLDGNPLKVTFQAVVDNLASIANHKMGEGAESKPIAIVRDSGAKLTDRKINQTRWPFLMINVCMFVDSKLRIKFTRFLYQLLLIEVFLRQIKWNI